MHGHAAWCAILLAGMVAMDAEAQDRSQGRSMVITRHGIVAAESPLAAQAGAQILARGGNAVDAAVAANAVKGLVAYARKVQQRLAAGRGSAHLRSLVEVLALVRAEPFEADHRRAAEMLLTTQKRRSLIVWLTDLAETPAMPEVIESALQMTSRHLVLFGVISQPELAQLAAPKPKNATEMYRHIAAQEMLLRRELLLRQLRQQGALAVEFEPGRLSTALVNHYLEIKERSQL